MTKIIKTTEKKVLDSMKTIYWMKKVENTIIYFNKNYMIMSANEKEHSIKEIRNKLKFMENNYL